MITTKQIREMAANYADLPRTNKFKRAVDLALAQNLPLEIKIATPFRGFKRTVQEGKHAGKTVWFKVRVRNTNTNQAYYFGRYAVESRADNKCGIYRGCSYGAPTFEWINQNILRDHPDADLSKVEYQHTGDHTVEIMKAPITWSGFALAISRVCKKDFAHTSPCWKCDNASGFIQAFAHVDGGVCWECCGSGYSLKIGADAVKAEK